MEKTTEKYATFKQMLTQKPEPEKHPLGSIKPSGPFAVICAAAVALTFGGYAIALWHHPMTLAEKGFSATILPFGLFGAISLAKTFRDKSEGLPASPFYLALSALAVGLCLTLGGVGLFNAQWPVMDKAFFGIMSLLAMFSAIVIQKNVRDAGLMDSLLGAVDGQPVGRDAGSNIPKT